MIQLDWNYGRYGPFLTSFSIQIDILLKPAPINDSRTGSVSYHTHTFCYPLSIMLYLQMKKIILFHIVHVVHIAIRATFQPKLYSMDVVLIACDVILFSSLFSFSAAMLNSDPSAISGRIPRARFGSFVCLLFPIRAGKLSMFRF